MATRRNFIKIGSLATVAGATGIAGKTLARTPGGTFELPADRKHEAASFYTGKNFAPHLDTSFSLAHKDLKKRVSLTLIDLEESTHKPDRFLGIRTKSTSLIFEGSKSQKLNQEVYEFRHAKIRKFKALVVPINSEGNRYEVVFSRI